jgi:phage host-nuclease inhibitor protein Gam
MVTHKGDYRSRGGIERLMDVTGEVLDLPEIKSRDQAEAAMAIIAAKCLLRDRAVYRKNRILMLAQRRGKQIEELSGAIAKQEARLKVWSESKEIRTAMGEKKTLELRHGFVRFRLGNPATRCLQGWTWDLVLKKLRGLRKKKPEKWEDYIRTNEDVNRQQLLTDSRPECGKLTEKDLKKIGVEIWREEHFCVDVKQESPKP